MLRDGRICSIEYINGLLLHTLLSDMPDSTGVITDHDTRLVAKVQTGTPVTPSPFAGMFWLDTDATLPDKSTFTVRTVTDTATVLTTDMIVFCNKATAFTLTLPTAVGVSGKVYWLENEGAGTVTVDGDGAETINGSATQSMAQDEAITIASNGTEWRIL